MSQHTAVRSLSSGSHLVRVEYYENAGGAILAFDFERVEVGADVPFTAEYFNNISLEGVPVLSREDSQVNFNWGMGSPDLSIGTDNFSARWTKSINFAGGNYTFNLKSDDGLRFYIDDNLVIDDWTDHPLKVYMPSVDIPAGEHIIKLEYYEKGGQAVVIFDQN